MAGIVVTPTILREKASTLKTYRDEHDATIEKIRVLVNNLSEVYKGESATAYIERFNGLKSTFDNFSQLLEDLAQQLIEDANRFEEADLNHR